MAPNDSSRLQFAYSAEMNPGYSVSHVCLYDAIVLVCFDGNFTKMSRINNHSSDEAGETTKIRKIKYAQLVAIYRTGCFGYIANRFFCYSRNRIRLGKTTIKFFAPTKITIKFFASENIRLNFSR